LRRIVALEKELGIALPSNKVEMEANWLGEMDEIEKRDQLRREEKERKKREKMERKKEKEGKKKRNKKKALELEDIHVEAPMEEKKKNKDENSGKEDV
jgi:sRNA-binding protein